MDPIRDDLPERFPDNVFAVLVDLDLQFDDFWPGYSREHGVYLLINCNDYFYYASADAEVLAAEDFPLFLQTARELGQLDSTEQDEGAIHYLAHLYAARRRNLQPLRPRMYGHTYASGGKIEPMSPGVLALFEALSPE